MKEKRELNNKTGIGIIALLVFIAMVVTSINACGYLGIFGELSWKEEVLLHDGSKIIVKRWQKFSTANTFDPNSLIKEQSISFKLPGTYKKIVWKDGATKDIWNSVNFTLIALHIKDNIPYLITNPYGCNAYNKWGRPNPNYVIFKYEDNAWKRIALAELPSQFKTVNLVISTRRHKKVLTGLRPITAERVKTLNEDLVQGIYKTIVRTPHEREGRSGCPRMFYDGRGWMGIGFFNTKSSYEECLNECKKILTHPEYCPCSKLFQNNKKGK
jgi:hypothetical protein